MAEIAEPGVATAIGAPPGQNNLRIFTFFKLSGAYLWLDGYDTTDVAICRSALNQERYLRELSRRRKVRPAFEPW